MICRHFNLSYRDVEEWLPWDEFYILMAVALDLDELDQYWHYLLAGGENKKWKWSSPDKAGTRQLMSDGTSDSQRVQDIFETAARMLTRHKAGLGDMPKGGNVEDFFANINKPKIQRLEYPDGRVEYRNEAGEVVEMPDNAAFAVIKTETEDARV